MMMYVSVFSCCNRCGRLLCVDCLFMSDLRLQVKCARVCWLFLAFLWAFRTNNFFLSTVVYVTGGKKCLYNMLLPPPMFKDYSAEWIWDE